MMHGSVREKRGGGGGGGGVGKDTGEMTNLVVIGREPVD